MYRVLYFGCGLLKNYILLQFFTVLLSLSYCNALYYHILFDIYMVLSVAGILYY